MDNPAATLHCPNHQCQAPNPQTNKFCQKCRTPLLRRYLWAIGSGIKAAQPGEVIAKRYLLIHSRVLLDTQPAVPPETPLEIPQTITPYLRLVSYGLHLPQVYGLLTPQPRHNKEIWLLEGVPIQATGNINTQGQLSPELTSVWKDASPVRQLNWLQQWASLWQPLSREGVASSLLKSDLVRVEGALLRLLELQPDQTPAPTLKQLGQLWSQLLEGASPVISEFCQQLCSQLTKGQIQTSEQLLALLAKGLFECRSWQSRTYKTLTRTDTGPGRSHNEDACYPPSGKLISSSRGKEALAMVCDGIGGQAGGEIASQLAIDTLRQQLKQLPAKLKVWHPTTLTLELEKAVCAANDSISQRNDHENRFDRQRMGTTLVMARTHAHEIYITHVGDSRIYWVSRHGCHQVTLDDDLASREVRLGYTLYRHALQQPTSGALVQALGMGSSTTLHPTVQRLVLDEDCLFLLCSDGLSDNDRVEQYWETEILPILDGQIDLKKAAERIIELANTKNGHDNVTVALIYCQVTPSQPSLPIQLSPPRIESLPTLETNKTLMLNVKSDQQPASTDEQKTALLTLNLMEEGDASGDQNPNYSASTFPEKTGRLLLGIFVLLVLGGVVVYLLSPVLSPKASGQINRFLSGVFSLGKGQQITRSKTPTQIPVTKAPPEQTPDSGTDPKPAALIKNQDIIRTVGPVQLLVKPEKQSILGRFTAGSVLQVIARKRYPQEETWWIRLRVCSPGTNKTDIPSDIPSDQMASPPKVGSSSVPLNSKQTKPSATLVSQGQEGWIREKDILPMMDRNFTPTSSQTSQCQKKTPPSSSPRPTQSP
ncbi:MULTISPECIES: protein phosphatase 2C domain-containing protein [Moorena]|uniref:PP2C family serine/threonine-protein phosphatase n=1 Tax=Moorena TaxID=1155738 RepID=UPI0002F4D88B|nr:MULTISPECIES: protein phosphatase 2C domain-containing protein [Moorena]NEP30983.1 SpoIIE family protein phosphatase [Moorena sp. SIO3B2]NEP65323.1 SpoIIE family protein phosphatase [Moorena sp. SIO3A5]NEQ07760.1 SpoIIE family protein phosphatase [Moorena sp. SIO4E2]NER91295.1 SpoIIE family protein phosphatase [Moorena sp. SIO3A2]NES44201.1 SpoIIE family protein phosphatase [Moorena sp. SIO2C4]